VCNGGGADAAVLTPGPAVEDSGDSSKENVAPVEVKRTLVEVGETEEAGGQKKSCTATDTALEQVLHPAAEEELFWDCDKKEGKKISCGELREVRPVRVKVQEPEAEAKYESDGDEEGALAQAGEDVAETEAEIEARAVELADVEDAVDAGVEEKDLVDDGEVWGPSGFEPAEIDSEADSEKDE
jgi:hypothetical protein